MDMNDPQVQEVLTAMDTLSPTSPHHHAAIQLIKAATDYLQAWKNAEAIAERAPDEGPGPIVLGITIRRVFALRDHAGETWLRRQLDGLGASPS